MIILENKILLDGGLDLITYTGIDTSYSLENSSSSCSAIDELNILAYSRKMIQPNNQDGAFIERLNDNVIENPNNGSVI